MSRTANVPQLYVTTCSTCLDAIAQQKNWTDHAMSITILKWRVENIDAVSSSNHGDAFGAKQEAMYYIAAVAR